MGENCIESYSFDFAMCDTKGGRPSYYVNKYFVDGNFATGDSSSSVSQCASAHKRRSGLRQHVKVDVLDTHIASLVSMFVVLRSR